MPAETRQRADINNRFLQVAQHAVLLPPEIEAQRQRVLVRDALRIKSHPHARAETNLIVQQYISDEYDQFDSLSRPFTLLDFETAGGDMMRLCDKAYPHATLEIMLISASRTIKPSLFDHEPETQLLAFDVMSQFGEFAHTQGVYPYISFSYDPHTTDRESGQGVKRFHAHLVGRTDEEISNIRENATLLSSINPMRARRIVDETSILGSMIVYDNLQGADLKCLVPIPPFSTQERSSPNLLLKLNGSWEVLTKPEFISDFNTVHTHVLQTFADIISATSTGKFDKWKRPQLRDIKTEEGGVRADLSKLAYMSNASREALIYMLHNLDPRIIEGKSHRLQNPAFRDITTHIYPLAGPCYSSAFYEVDGQLYLLIRPYMFSDLGGAGIGEPLGIVTKVKKDEKEFFTDQELRKRQVFQREFLKYLEE